MFKALKVLKRSLQKPKQLIKRSSFSKSQLLLFVIVFGGIGGWLLWHSFAAGPLVASLQAEQMSLPAAGSVITDSLASGGKAIVLASNGSATGSVSLPSNSDSLSITARGSQCQGAPLMSVSIDGNSVLASVAVSNSSWSSYAAAPALGAGTHNLNISFSNDYVKTKGKRSCDRNLYVDVSSFYGPLAPPTPAPTVALSVSPTSLTAGQAATLTWNSTNATSCSASGAWSGSQATSGSVSTGALNTNSTYSLTCAGAGGSASASAVVTVTAAPGPGSSSKSLLGFYKGAGNAPGIASIETWLGKSAPLAEDFLPGDSWTAISSTPDWLFNGWSGKPYRLVLGVPIIPDTGGTLAAGANGDYNAYYKTLAQNLAAKNRGDSILRLGWEFGGSWYHWHVATSADAANYAAYWRQIVNTMRPVAPNLKFDWNPVWGWQAIDPALAYPGDAYVDYVGIDVYDQSWISNYTDATARWNDFMNTTYGGAWHKNFAAAHGKQMSFPEWGEAIRSDGHGGGDDPYFIQQMYNWINANNTGYSVYFMFDAPDGMHDLLDGKFPNSSAQFKQLFSQ
jgi:hypothetical protein